MEQKYFRREVIKMLRLMIYCEGETEESFVNEVLYSHLLNMNIATSSYNCRGVSTYGRIKKEIVRLCKHDRTATITTMLDYYGLPKDTPGLDTAHGNLYERINHIELAIAADLGNLPNLIFNLIVHEFEGLLFTDTSAFTEIADIDAIAKLQKVKENFESPEHINNSVATAPSKRIDSIIPSYAKRLDGARLARRIGIDNISKQCLHFSEWITKITALSKEMIK